MRAPVDEAKAACEAAEEIREDICGRGGGDGWFEGIGEDIQKEILHEWTEIILRAIRGTA